MALFSLITVINLFPYNNKEVTSTITSQLLRVSSYINPYIVAFKF